METYPIKVSSEHTLEFKDKQSAEFVKWLLVQGCYFEGCFYIEHTPIFGFSDGYLYYAGEYETLLDFTEISTLVKSTISNNIICGIQWLLIVAYLLKFLKLQ